MEPKPCRRFRKMRMTPKFLAHLPARRMLSSDLLICYLDWPREWRKKGSRGPGVRCGVERILGIPRLVRCLNNLNFERVQESEADIYIPDRRTIQTILRHSSINTTREIYIKGVDGDTVAAMKRLEVAMQPVRPN